MSEPFVIVVDFSQWQLCIWEPSPIDPKYWYLSEIQRRKRYYVRPVHLPGGHYQAILRDTVEEALKDAEMLGVRLNDRPTTN